MNIVATISPDVGARTPRDWEHGLKDIIDIAGAGGATYRSRRHAQGRELPATAGNFLYMRQTRQGFDLVCCGETSTLSRASGL